MCRFQAPISFIVFLIASHLFGATPNSQLPTENAEGTLNTDVRVLQAQVNQLLQKLSDDDQRIAKLQQENNQLRRRLGLPQVVPAGEIRRPTPAPVAQASTTFLELPEPKWETKAATEKHQLMSGIPGASIMLVPFDKTLAIKPVSTARLALSLRKVSKSLGTESLTEAGSLWVQNGSLYLQWASDEQAAAFDALRYSSLEIRSSPDVEPKIYCFTQPLSVTLTVNAQTPVKLPLPAYVVAQAKLELKNPSGTWESTVGKDGVAILQNDDLQFRIKVDPATGAFAQFDDPDPNHAQRKLDALNTKYDKEKTQLTTMEATSRTPPKVTPGYWVGSLYYQPEVENRTYLLDSIKSAKDELASLERERPKLETEANAVKSKTSELAQLDGATVQMLLPNGILVSQLTLQVAH